MSYLNFGPSGWWQGLVLALAAGTLLTGCSSPQRLSQAEQLELGIYQGGTAAPVLAQLRQRGYLCTSYGQSGTHYDCSKTTGFMPTCVLRVSFTLDQQARIAQLQVPEAACIGTP